MKEKDFQKLFSGWAKEKWKGTGSAIFELKICKGISIRFDALEEHQAEALYNGKHGTIYHKINDMPFGQPCEKCGHFSVSRIRFTNKKPFDCFALTKVKAFVVVWHYVAGQRTGNREMVFVDIDAWLAAAHGAPVVNGKQKKSIRIEDLKKQGFIERF